MFATFRGRIIKTKEGRLFDLDVAQYLSVNQKDLLEVSNAVAGWVNSGKYLDVTCAFSFKQDQVFWKLKGTLRPLDTNNRIKPTLDGLSRIINVNDTYFITNHITKNISFKEMVSIKIQPCEIVTTKVFLGL
jgi:hypothetical protein